MTTIAQMTGIRRQDVPRTIRRLKQLRLLRCEPGGPTSPNVYCLALDDGEAVSAAARTGVRSTADGVSANQAGLVSAPLRTELLREHTLNAHAHRPAARSARARGRQTDDGANSEFEVFWRIYPHRGEFSDPKKPARVKFDAAVRRGVDPAAIIAGTKRYRAHVEQEGIKAQYVTQAKTWLNEERWTQLHEPEGPRLRVGMN
jgi:hypothetical protein